MSTSDGYTTREMNLSESYNGTDMSAQGGATVYGNTKNGSFTLESTIDDLDYSDNTTFDDGTSRHKEG